MPYVESHYRTIQDRPHRAIAGLSMGKASVGMLKRHGFAATFQESGWAQVVNLRNCLYEVARPTVPLS
jgi:hypothetical protein